MKNQICKLVAAVLTSSFLLEVQSAFAAKRIQSVIFDKGRVERISLVPGLASVILFPCEINEAIVGRGEDLKAQVSQTTRHQLVLSLSSGTSGPTNLIVRCGDKRDLFVFDVIASRSTHQDVVKIRAQIGGPEIEDMELSLVSSSHGASVKKERKSSQVLTLKKPKLVEEKR